MALMYFQLDSGRAKRSLHLQDKCSSLRQSRLRLLGFAHLLNSSVLAQQIQSGWCL